MPPQSKGQREWYERNKADQIAQNKEKRKRLQALVRKYKANAGCARCDEADPRCLDLHHVGRKNFAVAEGLRRGYAEKRIWDEIARCEVLCANCHRKEHAA